ncbi:hypothetical protein EAE96_002902 [Botrytis aclada]|nr:hypothetical protein EAE96_002902 [Botrytis aclada]
MASQPPSFNEIEESFRARPFKDSMSPQEHAEMLRQHNIRARSPSFLTRNANMMSLENNNLHGKDSQNVASMLSRFSANSCQDQYDTIIKTSRAANSTPSNMMQVSHNAPEVNVHSHGQTLKEMLDLPQPFIDFDKLRNLNSSSNFQEEKVQDRAGAPLTLTPEGIAQGSNNFKKDRVAHLPSNMSYRGNEAHTDMN